MAAERDLGGDKGFQIVVVVVGGTAAPFGVGGRRGILRGAGRRFGGLFGEDVVETGIQRLLDFGAGAEIAVQPFFLAGLELARLEAVAGGTGGNIARLAATFVAIAAGIGRIGELGTLGREFARDRRLGAVIGPIKQWIPLQ